MSDTSSTTYVATLRKHDSCNNGKRYFITGGGTGGHIYPAIAVAEALKNDPDTKEIFYIGNPENIEFDIVKKAGFKFLPIKVSGMPRKIGFEFIKWGIELELANWKALYYIYKYKPDAILGTGGYVSAPALFAGNLAKVPFMIHDSDAQPGIVSKFVAPMAKCVSLAFENSKSYIKSKNIFVNGNPIREAFKTMTKEGARESLGLENRLTLCVMGGSQGAKTINEATVELLKTLSHDYNLQVIFQTGPKKHKPVIERLKEIYPEYENDKNLIVKPYFDDMVTILKASDIAVSRAGSLSLSEICACGIAPILIPYPYAAADHQRKNARYLVKKEACLYLEDDETDKDSLFAKLKELLDNQETLHTIQLNSWNLAKLDSTEKIVEQLKSLS